MGVPLSRRRLIQLIAVLAPAAASVRSRAQTTQSNTGAAEPLGASVLPPGVRARFVNNVNGIRMHVLEAGFETSNRPAVLLVHGYPELAYSWRKVMLPLASAGYHVIAPDLRGYGRSGGTDVKYDDDLSPFRTLNEVHDMLGLVWAFGYRSVAAVVGHDFGSPVSAWCSRGATGRLSIDGADERAVCRNAGATVQHRERRETGLGAAGGHHLRRAREAENRRASITSGTTRRAKRTKICGRRRRASTTSCAPTTT